MRIILTPVLVSKHLNVLRTNYLKMHAKSNPNHSPPRVGVGWSWLDGWIVHDGFRLSSSLPLLQRLYQISRITIFVKTFKFLRENIFDPKKIKYSWIHFKKKKKNFLIFLYSLYSAASFHLLRCTFILTSIHGIDVE